MRTCVDYLAKNECKEIAPLFPNGCITMEEYRTNISRHGDVPSFWLKTEDPNSTFCCCDGDK